MRDADWHSAACHVHGVFFGFCASQTVLPAQESLQGYGIRARGFVIWGSVA
jgi:hypothetical protein